MQKSLTSALILSMEDGQLPAGINSAKHAGKVGEAIEKSMFAFFKGANKEYRNKYRSLHFNLKVPRHSLRTTRSEGRARPTTLSASRLEHAMCSSPPAMCGSV